jgi:hypothetical protein
MPMQILIPRLKFLAPRSHDIKIFAVGNISQLVYADLSGLTLIFVWTRLPLLYFGYI